MKKICLVACMLLQGILLQAQKNCWKKIVLNETDKTVATTTAILKAGEYDTYSLDEAAFRIALAPALSEDDARANSSKLAIVVPAADGKLLNFFVRQTTILQPKLAAKFPNIKTYVGYSSDSSNCSIHFDVTPAGFHATINTNGATTYINPIEGGRKIYAVYQRKAVVVEHPAFKCFDNDKLVSSSSAQRLAAADNNNAKIRVFRLALVTTGEYSSYFLDGTETSVAEKKAKVLSQLTSCVVRANAILERDLGVRLLLVDNEDSIIFLNPATDPYRNEFNATTQTTCDTYIGNANYDIGHVVHKDADNGNAGCIGCVCSSGSKGSAFTMYQNPDSIDPFVVDYLTHEIGHQLGANHTFTFSNEGTIANIEPGSGSTIMGYAGITGATDVQQHSDDYFHAVSIQQIKQNITSSATCAVVRSTVNAIPLVSVGNSYTIPKSTPFALKGNASDANAKNVLTYCWEQFDAITPNGSNTFPQPNSIRGPLFRSLPPTISSVRYFPNLNTILNGQLKNKWEALPDVSRSLNFRLTVRDNKNATNISNNVSISVTSNAGPFLVSFPDTLVRWHGGETRVVKWQVASTNNGEVNCQNVNILLSTDGGNTFPYTLAANTPNDGKQAVIIPNVNSKKCRIKVEAANNIFFDISNNNFIINTAIASPIVEKQFSTLQDVASIYPNPATNIIYVNATTPSAQLIIYNNSGEPVLQKVLHNGVNSIDIKVLSAGLYQATILLQGKTAAYKFIKQ